MNVDEKQKIEKFKEILKEHLGEVNTVDDLLKKVTEQRINLILVDCNSKTYYLHEPNVNDCTM